MWFVAAFDPESVLSKIKLIKRGEEAVAADNAKAVRMGAMTHESLST